MDKRWEELDNPEANARRAIALQTEYDWDWYSLSPKRQAEQEQKVLDAREKLEELARRLKAYKEEGEAIKEWLEGQDIPGVDCWVWSISELEDNDVIGDAIAWAAQPQLF